MQNKLNLLLGFLQQSHDWKKWSTPLDVSTECHIDGAVGSTSVALLPLPSSYSVNPCDVHPCPL